MDTVMMKIPKIIIKKATPEVLVPLANALETRSFQDLARYLQQAQRGECLFLTASINSQPIGSCLVYWQSSFPGFQACDAPEIVDLIVARDNRRMGYATHILSNIEQRILDKGHNHAGLAVAHDNKPARDLYLNNGYILQENREETLMLLKGLIK
jgi:ribosomal protein S18 acetylase RimI-like enzyme